MAGVAYLLKPELRYTHSKMNKTPKLIKKMELMNRTGIGDRQQLIYSAFQIHIRFFLS